ncbi:MAG: 50S ribosomal protein L19 [Planctomycetota bacterium]|nr:MAG: 50S ribosomal protein L19 [Planctomycetota bacterium]
MDKLKLVEQDYLKDEVPVFHIGDTVGVKVRIREGEKERIQVFTGTVIARSGSGINEYFTVRRIVAGEGVERRFPLHSPSIAGIEVKRRGKVRRAKLYYLRDRVGKATKVKELIEAREEGSTRKRRKRGATARLNRLKGESTKKAASKSEARKERKKRKKKAAKNKKKQEVATAQG